MSLIITPPTNTELKRIREEFAHLLTANATEGVWQRFFTENLYVLSKSLPLQLNPCDVMPMGRPGKSEPDFIIYPGTKDSAQLHGIIELKTPDKKVIRKPRRNILTLTSNAQTAIRQVLKYDHHYNEFSPVHRTLSFQSASYLFVIIGKSSELLSIEDDLRGDLKTLFPPGIRFLGFDDLFQSFSNHLPKQIFVLKTIPDTFSSSEIDLLLENQKHHSLLLHRIIPTVYPPMKLFENLPSGMDLKPAFPSEQALKDPTIRAAFSSSSSIDGQFQPANRGAFRGAESLETAIQDCLLHRKLLFYYCDSASLPMTVAVKHCSFQFNGLLTVLPSHANTLKVLDPEDFDYSVQLSKQAIKRNIPGIRYPSTCGKGNSVVLFRPDGLFHAKEPDYFWLHWDGKNLSAQEITS